MFKARVLWQMGRGESLIVEVESDVANPDATDDAVGRAAKLFRETVTDLHRIRSVEPGQLTGTDA